MKTRPPPAPPYTLESLIEAMARLRDPNGGCPWDLEQDFNTIAPYTIEESYEVADAIERGDMKDLREELGDLLFQPIYHAQMASENGLFDIHDVIRDVTAKMISRHPHVFGDTAAASAEDVNAIWDKRKQAEKDLNGAPTGALDGVAQALPALLRAEKLQSRAAKSGFEWNRLEDVLDKMDEELQELREAVRTGTQAEKAEELGDLMFVLVNFGRMLGISAETALRGCNYKFENRFKGIEQELKLKNQEMKSTSLEDLLALWQHQKTKEKTKNHAA